MRFGISGSRGFPDPELVKADIRRIHDIFGKDTVIVHGACKDSPDEWANDEAEKLGMPVKKWPADWAKFGRAAGPKRNKDIVNGVDHMICYWDGKSQGTYGTMKHAISSGKPVDIRIRRHGA